MSLRSVAVASSAYPFRNKKEDGKYFLFLNNVPQDHLSSVVYLPKLRAKKKINLKRKKKTSAVEESQQTGLIPPHSLNSIIKRPGKKEKYNQTFMEHLVLQATAQGRLS